MCRAVEIIINPIEGTIDKVMTTGEIRRNVGSDNGQGYRTLHFGTGSPRTVHSVIWEFVNGVPPKGMEIDHIDGNKLNNSIFNLRLVRHNENMQNLHTAHKRSVSGVKGVSWSKKSLKWQAQIRSLGVTEHLGFFDNIDDAALAYAEAASRLHTHNPYATT